MPHMDSDSSDSEKYADEEVDLEDESESKKR